MVTKEHVILEKLVNEYTMDNQPPTDTHIIGGSNIYNDFHIKIQYKNKIWVTLNFERQIQSRSKQWNFICWAAKNLWVHTVFV